MRQFGTGRPDQQDEKELLEFAAKIMQSDETQRTPKFPRNRPYREYGGVPQTCYQMENALPAVCAQRMPGGCYSLEQSRADR